MRDMANQNDTTIIRGVRGFDWSNRETPRKYIKNAFTRGKTFTGRDTLKTRIFCVFAKNQKTHYRCFQNIYRLFQNIYHSFQNIYHSFLISRSIPNGFHFQISTNTRHPQKTPDNTHHTSVPSRHRQGAADGVRWLVCSGLSPVPAEQSNGVDHMSEKRNAR